MRAIDYQVQKSIVVPVALHFDEEAKSRRLEMIERDRINIQLRELQQEFDFAQLKAEQLREQINGPKVKPTKKSKTKKQIRYEEKQRRLNKKNKNEEPQLETHQKTSDSTPKDPLAEKVALQSALADQEKKVAEYEAKILSLKSKIDQFDTAAVLQEAKARYDDYEELLSKMGCVEELAAIKAMEISIEEKSIQMQVAATAAWEARWRMEHIVTPRDSRKFRELVEKEKEKILEKRAKLPTKEDIEAIEKIGTDINQFFNFRRKINDFIARVDPDGQKAFDRLRARFQDALDAQEESKAQEFRLQTSLVSTLTKVAELSEKIAQSDSRRQVHLSSTRTTLEASIIDLEATLNSQRRKNRATDDRLFEIASIIERLYLTRSMLSILPVSLRENFDTLTLVVNTICTYLSEGPRTQGTFEHIEERVAKLEHDTLMAFIKIAKGETQHLTGRELANLKERLTAASADLKVEQEELLAHKQRWEAKLNETDENQQESRAIAMYRRDHYAGILKIIEHGLDVLTILSQSKSQNASS